MEESTCCGCGVQFIFDGNCKEIGDKRIGPSDLYPDCTEAWEKEAEGSNEPVWFRCRCGQSFNNDKEVAEASVTQHPRGTATRYFFEGGTVLYPPGGGTHTATCWTCSDRERKLKWSK